MYYDYFHLHENPFRLNTDTRYLYLSKEHAKAKAYLEYALLNEENLLVLSGEIGAGKSLIVQSVLDSLGDNILAVKIHQTQLNEVEFLQMLLLEFGIKSFHERKVELIDQLRNYLLQKNTEGVRVLLVIDEAQNLSKQVLEEVRFLSDMEFENHKLLNVFLVGQPELNITLDKPGMAQLKQRIRLRFHLEALKEEELKDYIKFRLKIAGKDNDVKISGKIIHLIYSYTGGRPRLINVLFDHALTCAFVEKKKTLTPDIIEHAINELSWIPFGHSVEKIASQQIQQQAGNEFDIKFVITKGNDFIGEFPIDKEVINIGRFRDNDIVLNDSRISRHHAQVINTDNAVYINDLHSSNGTFVDLKQIDSKQLHDGMVITIARFKLKYIDKSEQNCNKTETENILQYPLPENNHHKE